VWATRAPTTGPAAPQFVGDLAIDPSSLRPKLTVRSGLSRLTVDEHHLIQGSPLHKERLAWSQISRFELHFPSGDPAAQVPGVLVAITATGAVELPATRRPGGELRNLHALLDAYRIRAQMRANR
jgi:hypothetical protein